VCSVVLCGSYRVDDYFVHPPWTILLEGKYYQLLLRVPLAETVYIS
jgi:hypothetical protein